MVRPPFKFSARTRVGFSDTDAQGVVYYGRYNPYFDLARVEYLRALGLLHRHGGGDFVMRANDVEYFAPARFDDELEIYARVSRIGRTSVTFEFAAYKIAGRHAARHRAPDARLRRPRRAQGGAGAGRLPRQGRRARGRRCRALAARSRRSTASSTGAATRTTSSARSSPPCTSEAGYAWAGIFFLEDGELALGPHAGAPDESRRTSVPVTWQGDRVAELAVDDAPEEDRMFLERVAVLVSGHCLVGWDTGGESWEP